MLTAIQTRGVAQIAAWSDYAGGTDDWASCSLLANQPIVVDGLGHFDKPKDVVKDKDLFTHEKKDALDTWEQDARQLLIASNEGIFERLQAYSLAV